MNMQGYSKSDCSADGNTAPSHTPIGARSESGPVVCNWHPGHMGSVAHGDKPAVWFATAYQTSYDRHEGCWTAGLEVRTASEADARVMCERMLGACAPKKPLSMEEVAQRFKESPMMQYLEELRALEAIIHALCDERARMRDLYQGTKANWLDASDRMHAAESKLERIAEMATPEPPKPARKVLPVGHVPERLEVGMVIAWDNCSGTRTIRSIRNGIAVGGDGTCPDWDIAEVDRRSPPDKARIFLAAPFEVPND